MKILVYCFLLLSISSTANAQWDTTNTVLEVTYQVASAIDWMQTHDIQERWIGRSKKHEGNNILGDYPSKDRIDIYFLTTSLLHLGVSYGLSKVDTPEWMPITFCKLWQASTATFEVGNDIRNFSMGIRLSYPIK
jgi:hypothetical protein